MILLLCFTCIAGTVISESDDISQDSLSLKDYIQPNIFYCGPTVIYLLMEYWGMEHINFNKLVELMFSKAMKGTSNSSMVYYTQQYGLNAYSFTGNIKLLEKILLLRIPVVVLQDLKKGIKLGHFRIVVGFDTRKKILWVKDPARKGIQKMNYRKFISLWERGTSINNNRWALIVIPEFFEFSVKEVTHSPLTALNRGSFFYSRFNYINAGMEFKRAFEQNPNDSDVLKYYAQVLIRLKNYKTALGIIKKLITLRPEDAVAYDLMGLYLFYTGQYDQALLLLKKAVRLNRDSKDNSFIKIHYKMVKKYVEEQKSN